MGAGRRRWWKGLALVAALVAALVGVVGADEDDEADLNLVIHLVPHSHVPRGSEAEDALFDGSVSTILGKVLDQLDNDVSRRFVWAETALFRRWFEGLAQGDKERAVRAVRDGQLEFVGGGALEHDEALGTWESVVEQVSLGHDWIERNFGVRPRVAWQIDSAGHSDATPALLGLMGYEGLVMNRVHYRVKQQFKTDKHLEFVWRGADLSAARGRTSDAWQNGDVFTHVMYQGYSAPEGFDFESGKGVRQVTNAKRRADRLVHALRDWAGSYRTHHLLVPFGDELRFMEADKQFTNMEKLMRYINDKVTDVKIRFSTASEYIKAVRQTAAVTGLEFPRYTGDFYPYADGKDGYWSGFYSTREALKAACRDIEDLVRSADLFFALARSRATALGDAPRVRSVTNGNVEPESGQPPPPWDLALYDNLREARWIAAQMGGIHAITGAARSDVVLDYIQKLKAAQAAAQQVLSAAFEQLLTRREADFRAAGARVRPTLSALAFNLADDSLEEATGAQHPIVVFNPDTVPRLKTVHVYLGSDWNSFRYIQVTDADGKAVRAQVYHQLQSNSARASKRRRKKGGKGASGGENEDDKWTAAIYLAFVADLPPLGYSTYFCHSSSARERIKTSALSNAATPTTKLIKAVSGATTARSEAAETADEPSGQDDYYQEDMQIGAGLEPQQQQQHHAPSKRAGIRGASDTDGGSASAGGEQAGIEQEESAESTVTLENDFLQLQVSAQTGLLQSITDKRSKRSTLLRQRFLNYPGPKSGAFIFSPGKSKAIEFGKAATVAVTRGPVFEQVQVLGSNGVGQTVRLWKDAEELAARPNGAAGAAAPNPDAEDAYNPVLDLLGHVEVSHVVVPEVGMDTVVRYETNMDTDGVFYTDNSLGQLVKRTTHRDAPLPSSVFPATATVALRDNQATAVTRMGQLLAVVAKTPFGASSPLTDSGTGAVEIMLHRNHDSDDGRGVGEPLTDFSVTQFTSFLAVDTPAGLLARLPHLSHRARRPSPPLFADVGPEAAQLLSRDNWVSRFNARGSFLAKALPAEVWLQSLQVRDATGDQLIARFRHQTLGSEESQPVALSKMFDKAHKVSAVQTCGASGGPQLDKRVGAPFRSSAALSSHGTFDYISHPHGNPTGQAADDSAIKKRPNKLILPPNSVQAALLTLVVLQDSDVPSSLYDGGDGAAAGDSGAGAGAGGGLAPGGVAPGGGSGHEATAGGGHVGEGKAGDSGQAAAEPATAGGKTKAELEQAAEEHRQQIEAMQRRVARYKSTIDQLLVEVEQFDKEGKKQLKDAAVEDLRAAEQSLQDAKDKVDTSKKELTSVLEQIKSIDHSYTPRADLLFTEEVAMREFEATVHGAVAGAAAMLLFVVAGNWIFSGGLKLARGYVPISIGAAQEETLPTHKTS